MIKFRCSSCGKKLGVQEVYAGRRVRCPKCGGATPVPQPVADTRGLKVVNDRTLYAVSVCPEPELEEIAEAEPVTGA